MTLQEKIETGRGFMTLGKSWLEYQKNEKLPSGFTAEEEALLTKEYEKYLQYNYELYQRTGKAAGLRFEKVGMPMSFDTWWRTMADNANED